MDTPNTPAELAAMSENPKDKSPYRDPLVMKAMDCIDPGKGGNLGHVQAVAEVCLEVLRAQYSAVASNPKNHPEDREQAQRMAVMLSAAEIAVESVHFIDHYL